MKPKPAEKAKLFCGIMYINDNSYKIILKKLTEKFGSIEEESNAYSFADFTNYYEKEMGSTIKKRFVVFKQQIDMHHLADIKLFTNNLEDELSVKEKRMFNLDPGYFTLHKLVLASMKDRAHKIYLGKGVYADLALIFRKNNAQDFEWTFPDFKSAMVKSFFLEQRNKLKALS